MENINILQFSEIKMYTFKTFSKKNEKKSPEMVYLLLISLQTHLHVLRANGEENQTGVPTCLHSKS